MLPVVGVGVSQLVELALGLVAYVVHALIMCDHPVLLEPDGHQLTVIGVEFGSDLEGGLADNGCAFIRVDHQAAWGLRHLGNGVDALIAQLGVEEALYESIIQ